MRHEMEAKENSLQLVITDQNYIAVGDVKIYLEPETPMTKRAVKLTFVGPKGIKILRYNRIQVEPNETKLKD